MRIYVHDYAGHPFQVQLSRALARRGHEVRHGFSSTNQTPQGSLVRQAGDPETFQPDPITLPHPIEKYDSSFRGFWARRKSEIEYGSLLIQQVADFDPDVVLAANTPLDPLSALQGWCAQNNVRFVNWLQDLISVAAHRLLRRKLAFVGEFAGRIYLNLERRILKSSDAVVMITEDFRETLLRWNVEDEKLHMIENWAPIEQIPLRDKQNPWSEAFNLAQKRVFLYAGTLGMKHNPELLLNLALDWKDDDSVAVVVITEGIGKDWLREKKAEHTLENLVLLPYQPFDEMADVLGAADVLVAILEPDAGVFSVPSKVLTYLCAGKPVLLAVPTENLAARIVQRTESGVVVPPTAPTAFVHEARRLLSDETRRATAGRNARRYAEETFGIDRIADKFEKILRPRVGPV
ncbi:MAG: glycosyltransferase family 4 protein [Rubricoccaceae bacterium]|nr:glycosyltransferase family 4 protein [Rubricoccaceae bacterium]